MSNISIYISSYADNIINNIQNYFIYYKTIFFIILSIIIFVIIRLNLRKLFLSALLKDKNNEEDKCDLNNKKFKSLKYKLKSKIKNGTNFIVLQALHKPVLALTWILLFTLIFNFINPFINFLTGDLFYKLVQCGIIACLLWFGMLLSFGFRAF